MYQSTRSKTTYNATEAIIKGIADDGGLFISKDVPKLNLNELLGDNYETLAAKILSLFFVEFTYQELLKMVKKATHQFTSSEITPLRRVEDEYFLELFYGPTLAFKDIALTLFPYLLDTSQKKRKEEEEKIVLVATSGDTGGATLAGFSNLKKSKVIVFYPNKGISPYQEAQMLQYQSKNKAIIALEGNFDDCQALVKELFNEYPFLTSANSINIGRLLPQVVYYVYAYLQMVNKKNIKMGEEINFSIPTGNFGNIFAAYLALQMGLPIHKLLCASNQNNILSDFFKTGIYDKNRPFYLTNSPSMDIIFSSNLERLIWWLGGEEEVNNYLTSLKEINSYTINNKLKENLNSFYASSASIKETNDAIKTFYDKTKYIMDPHTAVAYKVACNYRDEEKDKRPLVIVATASYQKFLDTVAPLLDLKKNNVSKELDNRLIWPLAKSKDNFRNLIKEMKRC